MYKKKLDIMLESMNITEKILGLITDNNTKMILCAKLMAQEQKFEFTHHYCAAHILNIAVNYGMQLDTFICK